MPKMHTLRLSVTRQNIPSRDDYRPPDAHGRMDTCPRCGIRRAVRGGRPAGSICLDCRYSDNWYVQKVRAKGRR